MARCAEVGGVAEGVDVAGLGDQPVAVAAGVGHHSDRCARAAPDAGARAGEAGVTEGEDPTVGGHHEVAAVVVVGTMPTIGALRLWGRPEPAGCSPRPGIEP